MGIAEARRQDLAHIDYDIFAETATEFRFQIKNKDTNESILRSLVTYPDSQAATEAMKSAIHFGTERKHYKKNTIDNKHYFSIIDDTTQEIARSFKDFDSESQMNDAMDIVIAYLNISFEGMYLIENILLRPELSDDPFLPICPNLNCTDCSEADPYSYRLTIILPAYSDRFRNMNFRRFVEQVIREETPAHILPKICWIDKYDMAELEKLYRDWIYLKAGVEKTDRQDKLKKFIKKLFAVKSVYPPQKLSDCDSRDKFILGRTSLGTGKNIET